MCLCLPVILPNTKCAAERVSFNAEPSKGLTHHVTECCVLFLSHCHIKRQYLCAITYGVCSHKWNELMLCVRGLKTRFITESERVQNGFTRQLIE